MGMFSDLPADIMLDIFTRLAAEAVLDCKLVSKTWETAIHHPCFAQMHLNLRLRDLADDSGKLSFVLKIDDCSEKLCYLEYDNEISSHRVKKLTLNPPFKIYTILGSCNGLICLNGLPNRYTVAKSSSASYVAYICNPITRESITLPELDRETYYHRVDFMYCGFGYVASTNEYKVARLYTFQRKFKKSAQIEVYTLGSGKGWRNVGEIKKDSSSIDKQHAVFANGFLFWNFISGKILAFDLAEEIFVEFDEVWDNHSWPRFLGGHLCGTINHYIESGQRPFAKNCDVYLLKKNEEESFSWSKEFSFFTTDLHNIPLALTRTGVLFFSDTQLQLYDLKSSSFSMLKDFGRRIDDGIPHVNSLVSLKAFADVKTLESGEGEMEQVKSRYFIADDI